LVLVNFGVNGNSFKIIANGGLDWFFHSVVTNIVLNTSNKFEKAMYKVANVNISTEIAPSSNQSEYFSRVQRCSSVRYRSRCKNQQRRQNVDQILNRPYFHQKNQLNETRI